MMASILFDDIFVVKQTDPDGKKFDKVTRIEATSQNCGMSMHLDVNTEIHPMKAGEKFTMALASTLDLDGTPDSGYYTQAGGIILQTSRSMPCTGNCTRSQMNLREKHLNGDICFIWRTSDAAER